VEPGAITKQEAQFLSNFHPTDSGSTRLTA
jgi:hypothetical protein